MTVVLGKESAMLRQNNSGKGKRYDYVNVKVIVDENGEDVEDYIVAQILLILHLHAFEK